MGNSPSSTIWEFNPNRPLGQFVHESNSAAGFPRSFEGTARSTQRRHSAGTQRTDSHHRTVANGTTRQGPRRLSRRTPPSRNSTSRASRASRQALETLMAESRRMHRTGQMEENKWTETKVNELVDAKLLAPRMTGTDEPVGEYLDECPICFAYFPLLNATICCNKLLCTNCFLRIQRNSKRKSCPFCNQLNLEVTFFGPRSDEERFQEYMDDISLDFRKRVSILSEAHCTPKKDAVLQTDESFIETEASWSDNLIFERTSSELVRNEAENEVSRNELNESSSINEASFADLSNVIHGEEMSEEDIAMMLALHRSYREQYQKKSVEVNNSVSGTMSGSCTEDRLVDIEEDDSSFLEMFSLSSKPNNCKPMSEQSRGSTSVDTYNSDSVRLLDIDDTELSVSTNFYLDIPPMTPYYKMERKNT
eukprot:jgi/Galph1/3374/GphlegSOOS_G2028.1